MIVSKIRITQLFMTAGLLGMSLCVPSSHAKGNRDCGKKRLHGLLPLDCWKNSNDITENADNRGINRISDASDFSDNRRRICSRPCKPYNGNKRGVHVNYYENRRESRWRNDNVQKGRRRIYSRLRTPKNRRAVFVNYYENGRLREPNNNYNPGGRPGINTNPNGRPGSNTNPNERPGSDNNPNDFPGVDDPVDWDDTNPEGSDNERPPPNFFPDIPYDKYPYY